MNENHAHESGNPRPNTKVAVLGIGAMGSRIAHRLLDAGYTVSIWNRTHAALTALIKAGARSASTPREAAVAADVVLTMITDNDASREVWCSPDGAMHGLSTKAIAIEASTVTPGWVKELAQEIAKTGAAFIESPVVGSRPQADAGQLICLAGGLRKDVDRVRTVLEAFAGRVFYLGEHGLAAATKLAVNTFFATQVTAIGEAIHCLRRAGVDDEQILDVFSNLPVVAPPIALAMKSMIAGQFAPMFPITLVEKDLRYFLHFADSQSATRPVATAIQSLFAEALEKGFGDDNITGIAQLFAKGQASTEQ